MSKNTTLSANAPLRPDFSFQDCSYLAVRPISIVADRTMNAPISDYDEVQLQVGLIGEPSYPYDVFAKAADAIDCALTLQREYPHLRLWYNGHDDRVEFTDWRSLAAAFAEWDEEWEVVEQVAMGLLACDDLAVLEAAIYAPLIAVAADKVVA